MRKIQSNLFVRCAAAAMLLIVAGCASNTSRTADTTSAPPADTSATDTDRQVERGSREGDGRLNIDDLSLRQLNQMGLLEDVYFEFDQHSLRTDAVSTLRANAEFLRNYPTIKVQIEGHCDERGTNEYNLALGERRAYAARDYLGRVGIGSARMSTISYGEERPFDSRHNEAAWARNRRAHFRIVAK